MFSVTDLRRTISSGADATVLWAIRALRSNLPTLSSSPMDKTESFFDFSNTSSISSNATTGFNANLLSIISASRVRARFLSISYTSKEGALSVICFRALSEADNAPTDSLTLSNSSRLIVLSLSILLNLSATKKTIESNQHKQSQQQNTSKAVIAIGTLYNRVKRIVKFKSTQIKLIQYFCIAIRQNSRLSKEPYLQKLFIKIAMCRIQGITFAVFKRHKYFFRISSNPD